jgi:hypothetical protein
LRDYCSPPSISYGPVHRFFGDNINLDCEYEETICDGWLVKNIRKYTTNQDVKESRHNKKLRKAEQVHSLCTASRIIPEGADKLLRISTNSRAK